MWLLEIGSKGIAKARRRCSVQNYTGVEGMSLRGEALADRKAKQQQLSFGADRHKSESNGKDKSNGKDNSRSPSG